MIRSTARRLFSRLLAQPRVRWAVERELAKTYPFLDNPQLRFAPPGHFYSPLPDLALFDREADRLYEPAADDGVDLNAAGQLRLLGELAGFARDFDWPEEQTAGRRYWRKNPFFGSGDAAVLFGMIRRFRPRRVVEVGSGFSSALILDTNDRHCESGMTLTFIEPYPDRLNGLLGPADAATVRLIAAPVQAAPPDVFDALGPDDILFVDSSHVSKAGSDVNHLLFRVLPRLRPGVLVHVHDVFYPFEYPLDWLRGGRAWNELYVLRAFLQYNRAFEVQFFNSFLWHQHRELVEQHLPPMAVNPGGSIWLRKLG